MPITFAEYQAERLVLELIQHNVNVVRLVEGSTDPAESLKLPAELAAMLRRIYDKKDAATALLELRRRLAVHEENDGSREQQYYLWLCNKLQERRATETRQSDKDGDFIESYMTLGQWLDTLDAKQLKADPGVQVAADFLGTWQEQARKIADEFFDNDTKNGCRDSLKGYSLRVMREMQQRKIVGPRGIIDNSNTIKREALQAKQWWGLKPK